MSWEIFDALRAAGRMELRRRRSDSPTHEVTAFTSVDDALSDHVGGLKDRGEITEPVAKDARGGIRHYMRIQAVHPDHYKVSPEPRPMPHPALRALLHGDPNPLLQHISGEHRRYAVIHAKRKASPPTLVERHRRWARALEIVHRLNSKHTMHDKN